jgi:hypothetical protein
MSSVEAVVPLDAHLLDLSTRDNSAERKAIP